MSITDDSIEFSALVDKAQQMIEGDDTTTISTPTGVRPSIQKAIKDQIITPNNNTAANATAAAGFAQEAKDARDAANLTASLFATTAAGIAATSNGDYFNIVSALESGFIDLYKNNSGTAELVKSYPIPVPEPVCPPSLVADFANNKYQLAGDNGLEDKAFADVLQFSRATTKARTNYKSRVEPMGVNAPLIEYDPETGKSLGLYISASATNILKSSSDLTTNWALGGGLVATNGMVAPDGTLTADKITAGGTAETPYQTVVMTEGATYTGSVFVKYVAGSGWLRFRISGAATYFNIQTGELGSSVVATDFGIERWPNGWLRIYRTFAATANQRFSVQPVLADLSQTQDTGAEFGFWGAQLVAGAHRHSVIETTTTAVTVGVDACTRTLGAEYTEGRGTWYVEYENHLDQNSFPAPVSVYNASSGFEALRFESDVQRWRAGAFDLAASNITAAVIKTAIAIDGNRVSSATNGLIKADNLTVAGVIGGTELRVGRSYDLANTVFNGVVRCIKYYPQPLSAEALRGLTS